MNILNYHYSKYCIIRAAFKTNKMLPVKKYIVIRMFVSLHNIVLFKYTDTINFFVEWWTRQSDVD